MFMILKIFTKSFAIKLNLSSCCGYIFVIALYFYGDPSFFKVFYIYFQFQLSYDKIPFFFLTVTGR